MHIETSIDNCILRPWNVVDKAALLQNANNRNVWRNLTDMFPHPYTEAHANCWFEIASRPGRSLHFAIELEGKAVGGICAIAGEVITCATAQFGYWLGRGAAL